MNIEQIRAEITSWIENFVEVPHPSLGNWPPCPYAKSARLRNSFEVLVGVDPYYDLKNRSNWGLGSKEVYIYVYDPKIWNYQQFHHSLEAANNEFLSKQDIIALEDHPDDIEIVNGVQMNQGTWALSLVQSLSDLNEKARLMAQRGFYKTWPEDYLTVLFKGRKDPRKS
jgi:hypothetical protein